MFRYHLTYEEKEALLRLVGHLATADQEISPAERKFVLDLAHDLNVSAGGVFEGLDDKSLEQICKTFERDSAKRLVLVELLDMELADHDFLDEEKAAVHQVAETMGISGDEVDKIEDWVARGQKWHEEGRELLGLEGDQSVDV